MKDATTSQQVLNQKPNYKFPYLIHASKHGHELEFRLNRPIDLVPETFV